MQGISRRVRFVTLATGMALLSELLLLAVQMTAEQAGAKQAANTFRGSNENVLGPINLHAGVVVVRGRSNGKDNFAVWLVLPDPGQAVGDDNGAHHLMIDAVGAYNGAAAEVLPDDGNYYLQVVMASGPYELSVEQPSPTTVNPVPQRTFTGQRQQVPGAIRLSAGTVTVSAQKDGNDHLSVALYQLDDLGGGSVTSNNYGRVIDSDLTGLSVPVDIPADGVYLLYADAEGTGSGKWTVSIQ